MNMTNDPLPKAAALQGLSKLREPVPERLISPLPKGTKAQNQCNDSEKINCQICHGWHHRAIRHLDYVGHAAATHLLLDADPLWSWEPMGYTERGLPLFDGTGGLWIKLTVCGHTRLGYGHAAQSDSKDIGAREKEVIGDAIRNAAMRFGLALDLWSKADLHSEDSGGEDVDDGVPPPRAPKPPSAPAELPYYKAEDFKANLPIWRQAIKDNKATAAGILAKVQTKYRFTAAQKAELNGDAPSETDQ